MGHQPDPNAGPAEEPDPEPPAPGTPAPPASPSSAGSPDVPASQGSPDSSGGPNPCDPPGPADSPGSAAPPAPDGQAHASEKPPEAQETQEAREVREAREAREAREVLLAGFARGGRWDASSPGAELAAAVEAAAGPQWRCGGASGEQLIGILGRVAAVESWAGAVKMGVLRALIRDDDPAFLCGARHGDLPDLWDDSLTAEIALALAASAPSAGKTMRGAWELGARLPEIGTLLETGVIDVSKARLIIETFEELSDESAGRAEAMLVPELTEPPAKTYAQVEQIANAIALIVDPQLGERRRKAAEKHAARVQMFRERAGTAALTGRDLPTDQTLAAYAKVCERAAEYKRAKVFAKAGMDQLRAAAYLDLLTGVTAADRIAHGLLTEQSPADDQQPHGGTSPDARPSPDDGPGPAGGPRTGGDECPCDECDGSCAPDDDSDPDDSDPDEDGPDDTGPGPDGDPGDGGPDGDSPPRDAPRDDQSQPAADGTHIGGGPRPGAAPPPHDPAGPRPVLQDFILPLATLLGLADKPGEGHGLGAFDPDLCRTLAATAILSPHTEICVTITDLHGIAIGHGCAKPPRSRTSAAGRPPPPGGPPPPLVALPARINLTITADRLAGLAMPAELAVPAGQPKTGPPKIRQPKTGRSKTGWALALRGAPDARAPSGTPGDPDWCRPWTLTLPGGRQLTVHLEPVPTYECDHRNESHSYHPNGKLRHLVQVRDHTCTFPPCSRHARDSDFEHAVPYDKGGRTCACNAGARSRNCHRVKQAPGWTVTQPRPGWHQWDTPRGRTYTQGPKRYPG